MASGLDIEQIKEPELQIQNIYAALGHAIRFDIVQYLGAFHRPVQYTELVEWLQIKPGSFYFHMKKLKDLVDQDAQKRFFLTDLGKVALEVIQSGEKIRTRHQNHDEKNIETTIQPERFSITFFGEFIRRRAFDRFFMLIIVLIIGLELALLTFSKMGIIPFFVDGDLYMGFFGTIIELIFTFIIIWLLMEILMRFISPLKGFSLELLSGIPLALLPLFIYPLLIVITEINPFLPGLSEILTNTQITIIIMFILQILSAVFLIQLLQVIKSVNFERGLIPVFVILYGFSILSFLISSL
ncbi:MAG: winged helix-turn-helix domain-containing protein [Candidatus Hodarchaeales archaeon]